MNTAEETTRLVLDAAEGSRDAFAQLVRLNHRPVRSFLCRFVPQADAADDLAQEVFLVAFRRLGEYRGDAAFASWLLGIARNLALDYLRRESRRRRRDIEAAIAQWQAERLDHLGQNAANHEQTLAALQDCMDALPPESRWFIDRFYFEDQTAESIAQQVERKPGAVRMTLMRIRRALANCIEAKLRRGPEYEI